MTIIDPYQKVCKYIFCKKEFIAKRTNQEFCCRDHYVKQNNYIAKNNREIFKKDENIIRTNRLILNSFDKKEYTVRKEELTSKGFKFNHCTKITKIGSELIYCYYEFYIKLVDNETFKIYKNE